MFYNLLLVPMQFYLKCGNGAAIRKLNLEECESLNRTCPKSFLTPYFTLLLLIFWQNYSPYFQIRFVILSKN